MGVGINRFNGGRSMINAELVGQLKHSPASKPNIIYSKVDGLKIGYDYARGIQAHRLQIAGCEVIINQVIIISLQIRSEFEKLFVSGQRWFIPVLS